MRYRLVTNGSSLLAFFAVAMAACGSDPVSQPSKAGAPSPASEGSAPPSSPFGGQPAEELRACAEGATPVEREAANVVLLLDRSGSMHIAIPAGGTRWTATRKGLFDLLDALSSDTWVGAMMFPQGDAPVGAYCGIDPTLNDVKCTAGWPEPDGTARCNSATYTPGVASASLTSSQAQAIRDHVSASDADFYWGTPLAPALQAAIGVQKASSASGAGARSVILLTDGNPTSCGDSGISNDIGHVVDVARDGVEGTLVRTFVIGVIDDARQAAKAENLSPVAAAGGTGRFAGCEATNECFYPVTAANFATDIRRVFDELSFEAFRCTFPVPRPATGATIDPTSLNVEASDGGSTFVVPRDLRHEDGWDYLPGETQIQVYGAACRKLADSAVSVRIVVGCKTKVR